MEAKEKNPKEIILKQFDKLYSTAEDIMHNWNTKIIPENTLKKVLKFGKINLEKVEEEATRKVLEEYNLILDEILKESKKLFLEFDKKGLPLAVFKELIERVKTAFSEGYDRTQKEQ